jgi:hypothetical protein
MGNRGHGLAGRLGIILALVSLILLGQSLSPQRAETASGYRTTQDLLLGADELGGGLSMLSEGTYAMWKASAAWKQVFFPEEGLRDSQWRLFRASASGYGALTLRQHLLLYDSADAAGAALNSARQQFTHNPMYLQEGGPKAAVQPYQRVTTTYGDETWGVAWVDLYGVRGYAALVRYGNTVLLLNISSRDLTSQVVQRYHRLIEAHILGDGSR